MSSCSTDWCLGVRGSSLFVCKTPRLRTGILLPNYSAWKSNIMYITWNLVVTLPVWREYWNLEYWDFSVYLICLDSHYARRPTSPSRHGLRREQTLHEVVQLVSSWWLSRRGPCLVSGGTRSSCTGRSPSLSSPSPTWGQTLSTLAVLIESLERGDIRGQLWLIYTQGRGLQTLNGSNWGHLRVM